MKRKLFPVLLLIAAAVIFANAWWAFQSVNRLAINASWVAHSWEVVHLALQEDYSASIDDAGRDYIAAYAADAAYRCAASAFPHHPGRNHSRRLQYERPGLVHRIGPEGVQRTRLTANADPRLIRIALENLIGNAVKFTSKVPHARVAFGRDKQENACICVTTALAST